MGIALHSHHRSVARCALLVVCLLTAFTGVATASQDSALRAAAAKIDAVSPGPNEVFSYAAAKQCVVKTQNPRTGKLVTVYKTKTVRVKVKGKTVKKKVFVYKLVKKKVKVNGRSVTKKVRVKVPKKAACTKTKL